MRRHMLALALLLCLLPGGCARRVSAETTALSVYYCAADGGLKSGSALVKLAIPVTKGTDLLHEALRSVVEAPDEPEVCSAFPENIRIVAYSLEDGCISVDLTEGYSALRPMERTLISACLTLTLCALDEVDSVCICEEGSVVETDLSAASFLRDSLPEGEEPLELQFWIPSPAMGCCIPQQQTVRLRGSFSVTEAVLRQLLQQLQPYGLPKDTQVLSVSWSGGICTVDLSADFRTVGELTEAEQRLLLDALVNTLTELENVESVLLRCEGSAMESLGGRDLSQPITRQAESPQTHAGEK